MSESPSNLNINLASALNSDQRDSETPAPPAICTSPQGPKTINVPLNIETDPDAVLPQFWYPPGGSSNAKLKPIDVTEKGEVVLTKVKSLKEQADDFIQRLWSETGFNFEQLKAEDLNKAIKKGGFDIEDNDDDSESESGKEDAEAKEDAEVKEDAEAKEDEGKPNEELKEEEEDDKRTIEKFEAMRNSVSRRLWEAQTEAGVTLGLANMLLANPLTNPELTYEELNTKWSTLQPPLPLPLDSIHYAFAKSSDQGFKRDIIDIKLQLSCKRSQIISSSQMIKKAAKRVLKTSKNESTFWDRLLKLKALGWFIQGSRTHPSYKGAKPLFINYGYGSKGTSVQQMLNGSLVRDEHVPGGMKILVTPEHNIPKVVHVSVVHSTKNSDLNPVSDLIVYQLPFQEIPIEVGADEVTLACHHKLQQARSTALEIELFRYLTQEARNMDGVISLSDDTILASINDEYHLRVTLVTAPSPPLSFKLQDGEIKRLDLKGLDKICYDMKVAMLAQLRLVHHQARDTRQKKMLELFSHHPDEDRVPLPPSNKPTILLAQAVDLAKYHFFLTSTWTDTLSTLRSIKLSPKTSSSSHISRLKAELVPLPGHAIGTFPTSHLIVITIFNIYQLQFSISLPYKLQAMFPTTFLPLDRDISWYQLLLKAEISKCLISHQGLASQTKKNETEINVKLEDQRPNIHKESGDVKIEQ